MSRGERTFCETDFNVGCLNHFGFSTTPHLNAGTTRKQRQVEHRRVLFLTKHRRFHGLHVGLVRVWCPELAERRGSRIRSGASDLRPPPARETPCLRRLTSTSCANMKLSPSWAKGCVRRPGLVAVLPCCVPLFYLFGGLDLQVMACPASMLSKMGRR